MIHFLRRLMHTDRMAEATVKLEEQCSELDKADEELDQLLLKLKETRTAAERRSASAKRGQQYVRTLSGRMYKVVNPEENNVESAQPFRQKLPST